MGSAVLPALARGSQHGPGVLGAAAARAVDDEAPGGGDPGEGEVGDADVSGSGAGDIDERAQVDVPGVQRAVLQSRHRGERDDLLGDPVPGIPGDLGPPVGDLGGRGGRADEDTGAAEAVDRLGDQLADPLEDGASLGPVPRPVGRHRVQQRVLVEVVNDQLGHEGIHRLVVGDAVAGRVGQRDMTGGGDVEHGRAQGQVDQFLVDAQVQDADRLPAAAVHDPAAGDGQVVGTDQQQTGTLGEALVLEPGGAVRAAGQQRGVGAGLGRGEQRGAEQLVGGGRVGQALGAGELGQDGVEQPAGGDRIGGAAGGAQVVLEDLPAAVLVAHDVEAHDGRADGGGRQPGRLLAPPRPTQDGVAAQDAVGEDPLLAVDVTEEQLERAGPLDQALGKLLPLVAADDPRHEVDGEQLLAVADAVGEPVLPQPVVAGLFAALQLLRSELEEGLDDAAVGRAREGAGADRLVAGPAVVAAEDGDRSLARPPVGLLDDEPPYVDQLATHGEG